MSLCKIKCCCLMSFISSLIKINGGGVTMRKKQTLTRQKTGAIIYCESCKKEVRLSSRYVVTKGLVCRRCGSKETMLKVG
jgi:hypothetical protein